MFKKRSKKGLSHVDWAMSLAIFLLYLSWFFIFVKPLILPPSSIGDLLDVLQTGVEDNIFVNMERVHLFIPDSTSNQYEPIIVDFSKSWDSSKISHSADYFEVDDNKMFFLGNLSNTTKFTMYYPHNSLHKTDRQRIVSSPSKTSFEDFSVFFDDSLLDYVHYDNIRALESFSIEVDESDYNGDEDYVNFSLMAKYLLSEDNINNSAYTFADNSNIYSFIKSNDFQNHSVVLHFVFYNYSKFYFDPVSNGDLSYSARQSCKYYESNFLDLYNIDQGVVITFDNNISYRLCTNESNVILDLEFDLVGESAYNLYFYKGSYNDMLSYPITPIEGVTENLKVVSREYSQKLRNNDYSYLKQLFGYPNNRDFNVSITSNSFSATYGIDQPLTQNIYAKKIEAFRIDKNLDQEIVSVSLSVW